MDYDSWLRTEPYSWSQSEKEYQYIAALSKLTHYHQEQCELYGKALSLLLKDVSSLERIEDIPILPITLFKKFSLKSIADDDIFKIITSSGTSGQAVSRIFLDAFTAKNQQLALYSIVKDFIGSNRLPMLIIDTPTVVKNRDTFNARGAAILGFTMFARRKAYALTDTLELDIHSIHNFLSSYGDKPFLIFGFTFMIWKYLYEAAAKGHYELDLSNAYVIHGGGWKKMKDKAVSSNEYKHCLYKKFHIQHVHNYYGMAEQTGSIYMECEEGHLHASIFSDILVRNPKDFSLCSIGEKGIIQVLSPLATSYPGHSILTEDEGIILGIDDCPCGRKGKYFRINGRIPKAEIRGCSDVRNY